MMRRTFNSEILIEAKRLFVFGNMSAHAISKLPGMPTASTLLKKSKAQNKGGLTWEDERDQFMSERLALLAPGGMVKKLLDRINKILLKDIDMFTTKDADALSKLHKSLTQITDKKYHVHMMFQVMEDYLKFLRDHYKELLEDGKIFNSVRNFKNSLLRRLGENV